MRKAIHIVLGTAAAATPLAGTVTADAASTKVITVKKTITGPEAQVGDRPWGYIKVTLVVRKTTTITGTKKKVTRRIINASVPEYPNHTDRSVYINRTALPYLLQEVMTAQMNPNIQMISGATDTSYGFIRSLQAAISQAKRV
jgi:uncharacterized protein with FMN-binding domain